MNRWIDELWIPNTICLLILICNHNHKMMFQSINFQGFFFSWNKRYFIKIISISAHWPRSNFTILSTIKQIGEINLDFDIFWLGREILMYAKKMSTPTVSTHKNGLQWQIIKKNVKINLFSPWRKVSSSHRLVIITTHHLISSLKERSFYW